MSYEASAVICTTYCTTAMFCYFSPHHFLFDVCTTIYEYCCCCDLDFCAARLSETVQGNSLLRCKAIDTAGVAEDLISRKPLAEQLLHQDDIRSKKKET